MTPRASPIRHRVTGYTRSDGKYIQPYMRGEGEREQSPRKPKGRKTGSGYIVTLEGAGKDETYKGFGSPVSSLRQAVGKLQRPFVPSRAVLRRVRD